MYVTIGGPRIPRIVEPFPKQQANYPNGKLPCQDPYRHQPEHPALNHLATSSSLPDGSRTFERCAINHSWMYARLVQCTMSSFRTAPHRTASICRRPFNVVSVCSPQSVVRGRGGTSTAYAYAYAPRSCIVLMGEKEASCRIGMGWASW